jgi:hypothetical protein
MVGARFLRAQGLPMPSYVARTVAFAVAYAALFWATAQSFGQLLVMLPPIALGAVWLVVQARFDRRRLDLIALGTAGAVGASVNGAGLMLAAVVAICAVVPPLLFVKLLQTWAPGYLPGHGTRFRRSRATVAKLLGASAASAAAGVVITEVASGGTAIAGPALTFLRDTVVIALATLIVRALSGSRARTAAEPTGGLAEVIAIR